MSWRRTHENKLKLSRLSSYDRRYSRLIRRKKEKGYRCRCLWCESVNFLPERRMKEILSDNLLDLLEE